MPFVPFNPRLEGRYANPGPQRAEASIARRFIATLMNRDALQYTATTNSAGKTSAYLPPNQVFTRSANPQIPADLASIRAGTTRPTTARNVAGRRYTRLDMTQGADQ